MYISQRIKHCSFIHSFLVLPDNILRLEKEVNQTKRSNTVDRLIFAIVLKIFGGMTTFFSGICIYKVCREFSDKADLLRIIASLFLMALGYDCVIGGQNEIVNIDIAKQEENGAKKIFRKTSQFFIGKPDIIQPNVRKQQISFFEGMIVGKYVYQGYKYVCRINP